MAGKHSHWVILGVLAYFIFPKISFENRIQNLIIYKIWNHKVLQSPLNRLRESEKHVGFYSYHLPLLRKLSWSNALMLRVSLVKKKSRSAHNLFWISNSTVHSSQNRLPLTPSLQDRSPCKKKEKNGTWSDTRSAIYIILKYVFSMHLFLKNYKGSGVIASRCAWIEW